MTIGFLITYTKYYMLKIKFNLKTLKNRYSYIFMSILYNILFKDQLNFPEY